MSERNAKLHERTVYLSHVRPSDLGIRPEFHGDFRTAIARLATSETHVCPEEILWCLCETVRATQSAAETCMEETKGFACEAIAVSGDDLLPLIALVIVRSQPRHLFSLLDYATQFSFSGDLGELSFSAATFSAAAEYLLTTDALTVHVREGKRRADVSSAVPSSLARRATTANITTKTPPKHQSVLNSAVNKTDTPSAFSSASTSVPVRHSFSSTAYRAPPEVIDPFRSPARNLGPQLDDDSDDEWH